MTRGLGRTVTRKARLSEYRANIADEFNGLRRSPHRRGTEFKRDIPPEAQRQNAKKNRSTTDCHPHIKPRGDGRPRGGQLQPHFLEVRTTQPKPQKPTSRRHRPTT